MVRNYFPVWRELKLRYGCFIVFLPLCSELLSRLKGIETFSFSSSLSSSSLCSELLSRLKGIETRPFLLFLQGNLSVRNYFPVWRELKLYLFIDGFEIHTVRNYFPVWRELKPFHHKETTQESEEEFGTTFPFEGNWNNFSDRRRHKRACQFGTTFPFEGNWNPTPSWKHAIAFALPFGTTFPFEGNWNFHSEQKRQTMYHTCSELLSRLKGIETKTFSIIPTMQLSS